MKPFLLALAISAWIGTGCWGTKIAEDGLRRLNPRHEITAGEQLIFVLGPFNLAAAIAAFRS